MPHSPRSSAMTLETVFAWDQPATPSASRTALALLLVTPDGGDGGPLGRIVASATAGPVLHRAPAAVADDELRDAEMVVVLLPDGEAESFTTGLLDRPWTPVVTIPWRLFPAHLASAVARSDSLRDALLAAGHDAAVRQYSLGVETFFQASHAVCLTGRLGPSHTHSWHVRVCFAGDASVPGQVLVDFAEARRLLKSETDALEGQHLNDLRPFSHPDCQPTVENVVAVLFDQLDARARRIGLHVEEVTLWENPTSYASCRRAA